jgi:Fe-S cluster assembly protein SufB
MSKYTEDDLEQELKTKEYKYGFYTDIESETFAKGLSEEVVIAISKKKNEPQWMTDWRLEAYRVWEKMPEPEWANVHYTKPNFQDIAYYSAPKEKPKLDSLDEVDPELLDTFKRLGISLEEQKKLANVAVDIVVDSVSVATTFKKSLGEKGIIFMPISEAIQEHPELVRKYLGTVIPTTDNFYAALNSAVFSDGSFCYIPKGVRCPMELSTYFRINEGGTGQFERTLVVADKGSYVSYLEGCTAPSRDENQLHAAVVELIAMDDAEIKYSTVQNWYPGNKCKGFMDTSRNRLCCNLEISFLYSKRKQLHRRILLDCSNKQSSTGRYWNKNDSFGEKYQINHYFERYFGRKISKLL